MARKDAGGKEIGGIHPWPTHSGATSQWPLQALPYAFWRRIQGEIRPEPVDRALKDVFPQETGDLRYREGVRLAPSDLKPSSFRGALVEESVPHLGRVSLCVMRVAKEWLRICHLAHQPCVETQFRHMRRWLNDAQEDLLWTSTGYPGQRRPPGLGEAQSRCGHRLGRD